MTMERIRRLRLVTVFDLLSLCVAAAVWPSAAVQAGYSRSRALAGLRSRALLQDETSTVVRVIDFDELANQDITANNLKFKEKEMRGALPLHPKTQPVQYGAYDLGPEMVAELTTMIVEQMVRFWE